MKPTAKNSVLAAFGLLREGRTHPPTIQADEAITAVLTSSTTDGSIVENVPLLRSQTLKQAFAKNAASLKAGNSQQAVNPALHSASDVKQEGTTTEDSLKDAISSHQNSSHFKLDFEVGMHYIIESF